MLADNYVLKTSCRAQGGELVADEWQLSWTANGSDCSARALLTHLLVNPPPQPPLPDTAGGAVDAAAGAWAPLPVPLTVAVHIAGAATVALLADFPTAAGPAVKGGPAEVEELGSIECHSVQVTSQK